MSLHREVKFTVTHYIYGAYGTGNLGDDALLKASLQKYPSAKVVAYGRPFLREKPPHIDYHGFLSSLPEYLSKGDTLSFCGGGLFWASQHMEEMRRMSRHVASVGATLTIERIGIQGIERNPDAAIEILNSASFVSVRDQDSVALLKENGFTNAIYEPDFALTLETPRSSKSGRVRIAINHSAVPFYLDDEHRAKTLKIYSAVANRFQGAVDFFYLPHTRHFSVVAQNDVIYGEQFWTATRGLIEPLPFPRTVEDLLEVYSTMNGAIGWRYHLLALGTVTGIPVAFLGGSGRHKYAAFTREHQIPLIDFELDASEVIESACRFVQRVIERG